MSEVVEKTLLGYVPELLDELERLKAEQEAARAELRRIDETEATAEAALSNRRAELVKPDRAKALAEAALTGEAAPPEPPDLPGVDPKDLEATIRGLQSMRDAPRKRIKELGAALRARTIQAFREAAERAAADLVPAAERVEALHTEISAAQCFVESVPGRTPSDTLVGEDWYHLNIPSSEQIKALHAATQILYFKPVLAGGDVPAAYKAAFAAFEAAKAEVRRRLGRWPLEPSDGE